MEFKRNIERLAFIADAFTIFFLEIKMVFTRQRAVLVGIILFVSCGALFSLSLKTPDTQKSGASLFSSASFRSLLAGGIAGFLEVSLMFPLENIKTQLQLQDPLTTKFEGMIDCVRKTIRSYGCLGLYGGLTPLLISSVPSHALRWCSYEYFCKLLDPSTGCQLSVINVFISGLVSGGVIALIIGVPAECIKTRLIDEGERLTPIEGWRAILRNSYKGVFPTVLKKVLNQGLRFPLYHLVFHAMTDPTANPAHYPLRGFLSGIVAGFSSVVFTQPIDVVKTKLQGTHAEKYHGTVHTMRLLYSQQGLWSLYAGIAPRIVRVSIGAGVTFSVYPVVKQWLQVH